MDPKKENLDDLIYKVMPKGKFTAPLVPPIQSTLMADLPVVPPPPSATPLPTQAQSSSQLSDKELLQPREPFSLPKIKEFSPRLKYGIIAGVVLILLIAGYFIFNHFQNKNALPNDLNAELMGGLNPGSKSLISDEWREKYFNAKTCSNQENCGDAADPDHDGLANIQEYNSLTDPNNPDSDGDGLADGDEKNIFNYDPRNAVTSGMDKYNDTTEARAKWSAKEKRPYTDTELKQIAANVGKFGFHTPTITTLDQTLISFYTNYGKDPGATSQGSPIISVSPAPDAGSLDRDTQRSDTIKQLSFALLKYKQTSGKYPDTNNFNEMIKAIQPLLTGRAINTTDPKNVAPYVYGYATAFGGDFKLTYFSETQNQLISINTKEAMSLSNKDQSSQRDNQRRVDLEQISSALELYSNDNATEINPEKKTFPAQATWKTDLASYMTSIPTDPQTKQDYSYSVSANKDSFALQATLEVPPTGKKGYLCTPEGCIYN